MPQDQIYTRCPIYENELIMLRPVEKADAEALLKCYSDPHAVPLFNSDNCHGDDFHYTTLKRMNEAVDFWLTSYENRWFVRWAVVDQSLEEVVGTIEMFHRIADDEDNHAGVLRIDLRSRFETRSIVQSILELALAHFYDDFEVERMLTKAVPQAVERRKALEAAGFTPYERGLLGYPCYFEKRK